MNTSVSIGLAEARNKLSELIDRVGRGEEFIITRHDAAIARLVPAKRPSRPNFAAQSIKYSPSDRGEVSQFPPTKSTSGRTRDAHE